MERRETVSDGTGPEFVLSDGSLDRHGTRINPNGWDLADFKRNPVALWAHGRDPLVGSIPLGNWTNVRVENGRLIGRFVRNPDIGVPAVDGLARLAERGGIRATSVGFNVQTAGRAGRDDYDFMRQSLLEASLVSVPSNPNALQIARSLDLPPETLLLAFGEPANGDQGRGTAPGEPADRQTLPPRGRVPATATHRTTSMSTVSQRVEAAEAAFNAARDAYRDHVSADDYDIEQADALREEMNGRQARLASLKEVERSLGAEAGGGAPAKKPAAPTVRRPLGLKEREPNPGDLVVRAAVVSLMAHVMQRDPISVLEERYRDHEATNVFVRTAVDPAKTTVSGWAAELVQTETVAFLETLRDTSFFPRLAALGSNLQFGANRGAIKIPSRSSSPSISGSFVAEGSPIPVRRFGLTSVTLSPNKMGVISYFTREVARYSNPQIEGMLRQEIRADTADTIDTLLIDATAGSTTRPAGLRYGVSALTASTDGGWAAIMQDINTLAAPFDTAKAGRNLVLLMNKREARNLAFTPGPNDQMGSMRQLLTDSGITPIASVNVPAGRLIMLDAADFAAAAGDQPEFDVSEQAVIHAEDTSPAQISAAGSPNTVAAPVVSMFQTASIALRMLLDITWAMRRSGMVQWMDTVDWGYSGT